MRAMQEAPEAVHEATPSRLAYGCLTHVPLTTDFPTFVEPILLGDAQKPGALNLRDLAPEWEPYHPILGGLAGTFAMKNHVLRHHPGARQVGLCQYRKLVSNRRISRTVAKSYKAMDLVSRRCLSRDLLDEVMRPAADVELSGGSGRAVQAFQGRVDRQDRAADGQQHDQQGGDQAR